jgi:hypothetical protein
MRGLHESLGLQAAESRQQEAERKTFTQRTLHDDEYESRTAQQHC